MKTSLVKSSVLWISFVVIVQTAVPISAKAASRYAIPKKAILEIFSVAIDGNSNTSDACAKDFSLTPEKVRKLFKESHLLKVRELHDHYIWAPCFIRGTLTLKGKKYTWEIRPGNTISTTFPDGKEKILGGKYTDGSSE